MKKYINNLNLDRLWSHFLCSSLGTGLGNWIVWNVLLQSSRHAFTTWNFKASITHLNSIIKINGKMKNKWAALVQFPCCGIYFTGVLCKWYVHVIYFSFLFFSWGDWFLCVNIFVFCHWRQSMSLMIPSSVNTL